MRNSDQHCPNSILLVFGIFIGLAITQVALAGSEETDTTQTAPVATVAVKPALTGPQVYNAVCIACHSPPGVGGAPAFGDAAAWAPRIAQGMDTLIEHALNGFTGKTGVMPKKGERVDLSDDEVIGAVEYMVDQIAK